MESSKMVQSLIGLRTLSQNWFRHFVAFQWNESDLCWLWCWFMRWDNLLLVKYSDLHTLSNVSTWSRFTHFLVFWLDLAIYALCRILMKCRDLRIFPGTNYRFPGTKNFSTPLQCTQLVGEATTITFSPWPVGVGSFGYRDSAKFFYFYKYFL